MGGFSRMMTSNFNVFRPLKRNFKYMFGLNEKKIKIEKATKLYETYLQFSLLKIVEEDSEIKKVNDFFIKYQIYKRLAKKFVLTQSDSFKYNENKIFDKDMENIADIFSDYDIQEK